KGYWNVPGGFMDYGESPEVGVEREAEEEIGVDIVLDGLLNVYVSGFPGKPAYTLGFVYKGHLVSEAFRLKPDEIEDAAWFTVDKALTLTRNPFAKWALVDFFLQSDEARAALKVKLHSSDPHATGPDQPTVFLDRDGVINRGRAGYVRTPDQFRFLPGAIDGMRLLRDRGWQLVIVTNQDAAGGNCSRRDSSRKCMRACSRPWTRQAFTSRRSTTVPTTSYRTAHAGSRGPGCSSRRLGT